MPSVHAGFSSTSFLVVIVTISWKATAANRRFAVLANHNYGSGRNGFLADSISSLERQSGP